jgi:hypothetical protein
VVILAISMAVNYPMMFNQKGLTVKEKVMVVKWPGVPPLADVSAAVPR